MKKILLTVVLLSTFMLLNGQNNVVRNGLGINVMAALDAEKPHNRTGISNFVEYEYSFSPYIAVVGRLAFSANNMDAKALNNHVGFSAAALATPLPKYFRYFKIGLGIFGERNYLAAADRLGSFADTRYNTYGLILPVRLYAIDNDRFELSAGWDGMFELIERKPALTEGQAAIYFGLKF